MTITTKSNISKKSLRTIQRVQRTWGSSTESKSTSTSRSIQVRCVTFASSPSLIGSFMSSLANTPSTECASKTDWPTMIQKTLEWELSSAKSKHASSTLRPSKRTHWRFRLKIIIIIKGALFSQVQLFKVVMVQQDRCMILNAASLIWMISLRLQEASSSEELTWSTKARSAEEAH